MICPETRVKPSAIRHLATAGLHFALLNRFQRILQACFYTTETTDDRC